MKKFITSILLIGVCSFLSAQSILNISGMVSNVAGSPAEGVFISLILDNIDSNESTLTDENGYYEFSVELGDDNSQGCFEVFFIDCTFEAVSFSDCYNPGNMDFTVDFIYCENGTDTCISFILSDITGTGLVLSVFSFGVPPFTYAWSDGSTGETLMLPIDAEGIYCVVVTDGQGCVYEACIDLTPPEPCFVNIFEEYYFNSVFLFAEGYGQTDDLTYVWSTGETGAVITVTESDEYCVTLTDGLGCESIDCQYIEIDSSGTGDCFAFIYSSYEADSTIETLFVEAYGVAPFTYVWTLGDSIVSTSNSYTPEIAGVYCVAVTDAAGCEFTTCYDYFIWEDCGVWIGCDPTGAGVLLIAYGYGAEPIEYIWSNGDVGAELLVTENGEYCVTIIDAEGCTSSACITVNVTDVAECFVPIEVTEFDAFTQLSITLNTDGPYEIIWSTGETGTSINVEVSGVYCVEVLELETGCFFTTCATVVIGGQDDCWGFIEAEFLEDSTALLTVIAFDNSSDSLNFLYMWSTGELTQSIEVSEEGTYCVTVTGSDNCLFETCIDVVFGDIPLMGSIIGVVQDSETGDVLEAVVDIYSILDDGTVELVIGEIETNEQGFFGVNSIAIGNYIALAVVEGNAYVPTYSISTTSWEEADILFLNDYTSFVLVQIEMIPLTSLDQAGPGSIGGSVTTDNIIANDKEIGAKSAGPLVDANIILMQDEEYVGQLFTDDEGSFKFTDLPFGTYKVILEIPGYPRNIIEVTLSEDAPNATDVEFETDATATSTENITGLSSLTLSPNPTSNILVVDTYFTGSKDVMYRLIDMNGKIIQSSSFTSTIGENSLTLDVTTMKSGIYNLVLLTKGELTTKRFVKM